MTPQQIAEKRKALEEKKKEIAEKLKEQRKKAQKTIATQRVRLSRDERKLDTRRKIIFGAIALAKLSSTAKYKLYECMSADDQQLFPDLAELAPQLMPQQMPVQPQYNNNGYTNETTY
jgi:hypothetical protein